MFLALMISIIAIPPVFADFDRSKAWFTSLSDEDRITLQTNLTLAGFYDAFIDGAFGPSTYRGLTGFQKWNGEILTGVLSDASVRALSRASDSVIKELDLQIIQDERGQIELAVPRALLPQTTPTSVGTAYTRSDGLMRLDTVRQPNSTQSFVDYYRQMSTENDRRKVTYQTYQDSYFVVSGALDGGYFYSLMFNDRDQTVGYTLNWSPPYMKQGSIVSLFLASFATPWTEANIASTDPAPSSSPAASPALPPSDSGSITEIGNFLVFKDMPGVIGLRGEIGPTTPLDFRRAVRAVAEPKVLMLASEGGYVASALLLAYEVRELGLSTYVLPETGCYSACSFVFFAGTKRKADGALGVHQVWSDDSDASTAQTVVSDILEAFADFGVRQEVTSAMLRTRPEDMYVFSQGELSQWGINAGDPMADFGNEAEVLPADAVSVVQQTRRRPEDSEEQSIPVPSVISLGTVLRNNGFTGPTILAIEQALSGGGISTLLEAGSELRVLYGPAGDGQTIPYRVTIHSQGNTEGVGVALQDTGAYVLVATQQDMTVQGSTADGKGPRRINAEGAPAYVQLASLRSEAEARQAAQNLITRFGPLFGGANIEVQRVDLGARGVYYRVRVPATSQEAANLICSNVQSAGGDCVVL
ncbi:SPOR domain-containing protein [Devosia ginsengisoli]|uniref:SPOR domain-containing protein n=1 Tax=Devosia ginsengisoli TaxID=400770 RepID=UPI0026EE3D05|nr:SPOR domain-containing protein [Devosia ginsengisoli]MCR6671476.1 SPOR domain-containing protein [Devosia ginsengisoli]